MIRLAETIRCLTWTCATYKDCPCLSHYSRRRPTKMVARTSAGWESERGAAFSEESSTAHKCKDPGPELKLHARGHIPRHFPG